LTVKRKTCLLVKRNPSFAAKIQPPLEIIPCRRIFMIAVYDKFDIQKPSPNTIPERSSAAPLFSQVQSSAVLTEPLLQLLPHMKS